MDQLLHNVCQLDKHQDIYFDFLSTSHIEFAWYDYWWYFDTVVFTLNFVFFCISTKIARAWKSEWISTHELNYDFFA